MLTCRVNNHVYYFGIFEKGIHVTIYYIKEIYVIILKQILAFILLYGVMDWL